MGLSAFLSAQVIDTTSVGRSVMTAADAAAARAAIGAGTSSFDGAFSSLSGKPTTLSGYGITDAQPLDSDLTAIAALTTTTYGRSLLTGADAAATRTTLGLGTLATQSGTFSGTSSGTNTGDQTITLTGDVTGSGTGSFATTIANSAVTNAMLAGSIAISKLAITGTPDGTKFLRDDGTWAAASGGSGITSLNGLTGSTQTFAVGTSGTDFAISSTGTDHTFNIPDASASARGLVTTGTQTFAGAKTFSGDVTFSGGTATSGSQTGFTFTQPSHTGQTASTEATMVNWNLASTVTFAAGALTTQRAFRIQSPTYAFASASTITTASTLAISGAPIAGTNATITNPYALNVEGGASYFGGNINQQYSFLQSKQFAGSLGNGVGLGAVFITLAVGTNGIALANTLGWASSVQGTITTDVNLERDAAATLALRNSTNAQTFRVYNTFTSATNFEAFQQSWVSNQIRLGTVVGSAGGTQRDTVLGAWNSAGTWRAVATVSANSGSPVFNITPFWMPGLTFTAPTIGSLTASTEFSDVNFNLTATRTWSAGALTTQRAFRIQAPTYAFASASTITTASTLSISGAPIAGTNATITNPYALNVESGISNFNGRVFITDGSSVIETSSWAGGSLLVTFAGGRTVALGGSGIRMALGYPITFCSDASLNSPDVFLYRDAAGTLAQRNSTNAQTFRVYNTFTSATNAEWLQQSWVSNEARIGTAVGSAGGTQRSTVLGLWNSAGSWTAAVTIATTGVVTFGNTINISSFSGMVMGSDVTFARDTARTLELRSSTSAITFALSNTYTSGTNFEQGKFEWVTNEWRIGTAVGSAGGTQRSTVFGSWNSAGTWTAALTISAASTTVAVSGNITLASQITFNSDTAFRRTSAGILEVNNGTAGTLRDLCLRNFAVNSASVSAGGGVGIVFIANATTVPTTDPTGGGILYVEGGALKYRGSSGTVTTLAPA